MRDARKLFRLFKSLNEFKKIKELVSGKNGINIDVILNVLVRGSFMIYWLFDNLAILSKIKVLEKDPKPYGKLGASFWLLALVFNLILVVKDSIACLQKLEHLKRYFSNNEETICLRPIKNKSMKKELNF